MVDQLLHNICFYIHLGFFMGYISSDIKLKHFKVMLDFHTLSILNYSDKNVPLINAYT